MVPVPNGVVNQDMSRPGNGEESHFERFINGDIINENTAPIQYIGAGEDDAPRSPVRKGHSRNGSLRVNGIKKERITHDLILETSQDQGGERLVGIAPEKATMDSLRLDEKRTAEEGKAGSHELVSGRRAGAGWEQSG